MGLTILDTCRAPTQVPLFGITSHYGTHSTQIEGLSLRDFHKKETELINHNFKTFLRIGIDCVGVLWLNTFKGWLSDAELVYLVRMGIWVSH